MQYKVDVSKVILSGQWQIVKTERFLKETTRFDGIDTVLGALIGGLLLSEKAKSIFFDNKAPDNSNKDTYIITFNQNGNKVYFCIQDKKEEADKKIVFYRYEDFAQEKRVNDQSLIDYFFGKEAIVNFERVKDVVLDKDFNKLYRLSNSNVVNFPLLNKQQKELVAIEDQNVLLQGVAGSGKTNICIDKIVFSAFRGYTGKILYTTFSRGLLTDTKEKVLVFIDNLKRFLFEYQSGKIIFADNDKKRAIEHYLGLELPVNQDKIYEKLVSVVDYLEKNVDYYLIEDLYRKHIKEGVSTANERNFVKDYIRNIKNHQLVSRLSKIKDLSYEIIYKEIYGLIYGSYRASGVNIISQEEYLLLRKDSFNRIEAETIYYLAKDYGAYMAQNNLADNNTMSRELLANAEKIKKYSLAILDEVQDLTEVNLTLFKGIAIKLFCVGDALQMINPSYFSFAFLKRLLYVKDEVTVATLKHNYRNTKKIASIIDSLGEINTKYFGTHSFVIKGESIDSEVNTLAVYLNEKGFLEKLSGMGYENCTIIVADVKTKENLRTKLKSQEILTVSEIKGLERETVILLNVLSDNYEKWQQLNRILINRKEADENSVFRYYFNLFYVGISRAKANIYVAEEKEITAFSDFFKNNFESQSAEEASKSLSKVASIIEIDQQEIIERVRQFVKLEQYENAVFTANKILDDLQRKEWMNRIFVEEKFVREGNYREAGIQYWEFGMINDAKRQFKLSGDDALISLMEASYGEDKSNLNIDVIKYLPSVEGKAVAEKLILDTVRNDLEELKSKQNRIGVQLKKFKEIKNG
ncbi:hypothetical protein EOM82_00215 [bacterium]|nr:hypothetical protein [bacterium]